MTAYIDSSALAKLVLIDEDDREILLGIVDAAGTITTSRVTYVETRAAIASARRSGRLSTRRHDDAVAEFGAIWPTIYVIDLTQDIAEDAAVVSEMYGLRAGDSIQLASLRNLGSGSIPMIAWDTRLRAATLASGYACYPLTI